MRCDLGSKCKFPNMDVRDHHYCQNCRILLHIFCAARTGKEDHILFCGQCDNQTTPRWSQRNRKEKEQNTEATPDINKRRSTRSATRSESYGTTARNTSKLRNTSTSNQNLSVPNRRKATTTT